MYSIVFVSPALRGFAAFEFVGRKDLDLVEQ